MYMNIPVLFSVRPLNRPRNFGLYQMVDEVKRAQHKIKATSGARTLVCVS